MINITIGSYTVKVLESSLNINDKTGERSISSFVVYDKLGEFSFERNQVVSIKDGVETIFTGYVEKPQEKVIIGGSGAKFHNIICKDQHYLADKRRVAKAYESKTTKYIVMDIYNTYLKAEGITIGYVGEGVTLEKCVFNYIPTSQALDSLAEKSGYIWYIDYDKKLYFMDQSIIEAPWEITSSDIIAESTSVDKSNSQYRNKQYVKGGKDLTDPRTESFMGDGETQTFVVSYPIAKVPIIKVDNVLKTVGIRNIDSGKDWYWSKGSREVSQDTNGTKLTSSSKLEVTSQGEYDIVVVVSDYDGIETTSEVDGTTGIIEDVTDDNYINNIEDAFLAANAKLTKYSDDSYKVKFRTLRTGLRAGQMAVVNIPEYNISQNMLVESVDITTGDTLVYYDVSIVYGVLNDSWTKFFEKVVTRGDSFVIFENISENDALITLYTFQKIWYQDTPNNIFKEVYTGESTFSGDFLICGFEKNQRVLYTELLDASNNLLARKAVVKHSGITTLISTTVINPNESIGEVAKVRWYGGCLATEENWSGTMIDEQELILTKTNLEAMRIVRTDIKGW